MCSIKNTVFSIKGFGAGQMKVEPSNILLVIIRFYHANHEKYSVYRSVWQVNECVLGSFTVL